MEKLEFGDVARNLGDDKEEYPFVLITGDDLDGYYSVVLLPPENDQEPILGSVAYESVGGAVYNIGGAVALELIEKARANTIKEEKA